MRKSLTAFTWECDIPDCPETLTAYGENYAKDNGWLVEEVLLGKERDLCPDHYRELKRFLDE
jgi:hypothetical protein